MSKLLLLLFLPHGQRVHHLLLSLICCCLCFFSCVDSFEINKPTWTYTFLEIFANSSDESALKIDVKIERIGRGELGVSGTISVNLDITDESLVEVIVTRSATGSSDYKLQPIGVDRQPIFTFMNSLYKELAMEDIARCSNFPIFHDKLTSFERKTYTFSKCQMAMDKMPQILPSGYYKVTFIGSGLIQYLVQIFSKIELKST